MDAYIYIDGGALLDLVPTPHQDSWSAFGAAVAHQNKYYPGVNTLIILDTRV